MGHCPTKIIIFTSPIVRAKIPPPPVQSVVVTTSILSSAADSSEMENAPFTVPEATPGTIAAGVNTIPVKQVSVPATSPNKETTHLKIRVSQPSNQSEVKTTITRTRTIRAPKWFPDYVLIKSGLSNIDIIL